MKMAVWRQQFISNWQSRRYLLLFFGCFPVRLQPNPTKEILSPFFKVFSTVPEMARQRILAGRKFKNSTGARVNDAGVCFLSPTHRVRSVYCRAGCGESCGVIDILES